MADGTEILPPGMAFEEAGGLLRQIAASLAGSDDFGDEEYQEGLATLLASLDRDADLSEAGRQALAGIILTALAGRLLSEKAFRANPGYRDVELAAPIVILGLPRTGTTALQGMLCADPAHQGLELWLAQSPGPRPPRSAWPGAEGYRRCLAMLAQMPDEMRAVHPMAADAPDECWNLLRQSFASVTFECVAGVSGYSQWWARHDMRAAYRRWADNLRLIGMREGPRPWVLKDPSHLFAADALLEAVPDALIVMTHRDPAKTVPSVASLNALARATNDRAPDDARLGAEQDALWLRGIGRMMAVRDAHPENFMDIHFADFRRAPLDSVRAIYERAGRSLSPGALEAMEAWRRANAAHPHEYEADRFGLEPAGIRHRYARYMERFGVAEED